MRRNYNLIIYSLIFILIFVLFALRFYYASSYVSNWDIVDFVLGVEHFDLLKMQPHFPGYPYFIVGGMGLNYFLNEPVQALIYFNLLLLITSCFPIYAIARNVVSPWKALAIVLFVQSFSYLSLISTQAMSEAGAIAVLWWFIWSISLALRKNQLVLKIIPLFIFSLLLGIRLSYLPFGIGLLFIWYAEYKQYRGMKRVTRLASQFSLAIFFQMIWLSALAQTEGGWRPFFQLATAFVTGHFQQWGGAVSASDMPLISRFIKLIFNNILWTGLFGESIIVLTLFFILLIVIVKHKFITFKQDEWVLSSLFVVYFFWSLFAQNIEKPRHIVPLITILGFLFAFQLLRQHNKNPIVTSIFSILIIAQIYNGMTLMKQQATETPAVYKLAQTIDIESEKSILFTWEETRVLEYLQVSFSHERVYSYKYFQQRVHQLKGHQVYMTNKVYEGFLAQGYDISQQVIKVAEYRSSQLIEPVYHTITVYKWKGEK